jgi:hypothetical protein
MPIASDELNAVDQEHAGVVAQQASLAASDHITPDEVTSTGWMSQRSGSASSAAHHRLGERVADDGERADLLVLDRVEQFLGRSGGGQRDDRAAAGQDTCWR